MDTRKLYLDTQKWNFEPIKVEGLDTAMLSPTTTPIFRTTSTEDSTTTGDSTTSTRTITSIGTSWIDTSNSWTVSDHTDITKEWAKEWEKVSFSIEPSPRTMFTIDDIKALLTDDVRNSQEKFINKFMEIIESKGELIRANGLQASDILLAFKVPEGDED